MIQNKRIELWKQYAITSLRIMYVCQTYWIILQTHIVCMGVHDGLFVWCDCSCKIRVHIACTPSYQYYYLYEQWIKWLVWSESRFHLLFILLIHLQIISWIQSIQQIMTLNDKGVRVRKQSLLQDAGLNLTMSVRRWDRANKQWRPYRT